MLTCIKTDLFELIEQCAKRVNGWMCVDDDEAETRRKNRAARLTTCVFVYKVVEILNENMHFKRENMYGIECNSLTAKKGQVIYLFYQRNTIYILVEANNYMRNSMIRLIFV